jgi:hypothetical protein
MKENFKEIQNRCTPPLIENPEIFEQLKQIEDTFKTSQLLHKLKKKG